MPTKISLGSAAMLAASAVFIGMTASGRLAVKLHAQLPVERTRAAGAQVLPVPDASLRLGCNTGRTEFTYYPGMIRIPEANARDIKNKSFPMAADVEIATEGADGVEPRRADDSAVGD